MRRLVSGLAAAGLGAASVLVGGTPAEAAACSGSSGVTVVVDFGALGGLQVGCAPGDPSTGLAALHAAGFSTVGTVHDGPGFVCRISGLPGPDREACNRTPPASAYWAYWHASRGGSWSYSSLGALSYNPAPGTVEGWAFGSGARPGIAPPAAPAPPAPPKPTTKPPAKPSTRPPAPPAPPPTTRSSAPGAPPAPGTTSSASVPPAAGSTAPGRPSATLTSPGPSTAGSGTGQPSGTPDGSGPGASTGAPGGIAGPVDPTGVTAEPTGSATGLTGSLIGLAVILGLGAAGFVLVRRRRSVTPPG